MQCKERHATQHKAAIADTPYPFAPDMIGQVAERDLAGNSDKAHQTQRPSRAARVEPEFRQVFRLVNLHRIPCEEATKIARRQPPEALRPNGSTKGPVVRSLGCVRDAPRSECGSIIRNAIRLKAEVGWPPPEQQIERCQNSDEQEAERPTSGAPARIGDQGLQPRQDRDEPTPTPENAIRLERNSERFDYAGRHGH